MIQDIITPELMINTQPPRECMVLEGDDSEGKPVQQGRDGQSLGRLYPGEWSEGIDVRISSRKLRALLGDEGFLEGPTENTARIWEKANGLIQDETKSRTIKVDLERFSGIDNFEPGYIDQDKEVIVGLQTDEPLKRIMNPTVASAC